MLVNFRQGIVRPAYAGSVPDDTNIPTYLNKTSSGIFILASKDDPLLITFSHYNQNILFKEDKNYLAWPSPPSITPAWLYWDLNMDTGERTFGFTNIEPLIGSELPSNPTIDQHFFSLKDYTMKVWIGDLWLTVLRVFASVYNGSAPIPIVEPFFPNQSQVGLNDKSKSGYILFGEDEKPLKTYNNILTTETILRTQKNFYNNLDLPSKKLHGRSLEMIPIYKCITHRNRNKDLGVTTSSDPNNPCIGITLEPFNKGDIKRYITNGYISDPIRFNWDEDPNTLLFVGPDGNMSTTPPNSVSIQRIGYIVDRHTIYVDLKEKILIDAVTRPTVSEEEIIIPDESVDCGVTTEFSGEQSYPSEKIYTLGTELGTVVLDFDAQNQPDRYIVYIDNEIVLDTGYRGSTGHTPGGSSRADWASSLTGRVDPVTGNTYPFIDPSNESDGYPVVFTPGQGSASFYKSSTFPYAIMRVYAPESGTLWSATLNCPVE